MTMMTTPLRREKPWLTRWGAVLAVLGISLLATLLIWKYEEDRVLDVRQLQFERSSQILQDDILNTMDAYAQFLRSSVGLVHAFGEISRETWHQFVNDAYLANNYPAIQAVSINDFARGQTELAALVARVRADGLPDFTVRPEGIRDAYMLVTFVEPQSLSNERAIGFDIYSEPSRRAAVDRAISSGEPVLTSKITLVQESVIEGQDTEQAGLLLILPTYRNGVLPASAAERHEQASGLVVSVFRMGDLVKNVFSARGEVPHERVRLHLYDADGPVMAAQLFGDTFEKQPNRHDALFERSVTLQEFGRPWTFVMSSTPKFERETASASPRIVLWAGILLSMLLTSLVLGQSTRAYETELAATELASNQRQIELLMGEVNHRSKNLLSLVQAIARQTNADDPGQFVSQFSERVRALAVNQDLLVRNGWKEISLNELIDSQLSHFEGLLGGRIQVNGPDLDISAEASQTLGMALHELATNAGKYGALSNSSGTVDIEWEIVQAPDGTSQLKIGWLESGGPAVVVPTRKGFGTKVTDMMVKYALGGTVESLFEPSGFVWRLSCPVDRVLDSAPGVSGSSSRSVDTSA